MFPRLTYLSRSIWYASMILELLRYSAPPPKQSPWEIRWVFTAVRDTVSGAMMRHSTAQFANTKGSLKSLPRSRGSQGMEQPRRESSCDFYMHGLPMKEGRKGGFRLNVNFRECFVSPIQALTLGSVTVTEWSSSLSFRLYGLHLNFWPLFLGKH